jgi:hypothetical protein
VKTSSFNQPTVNSEVPSFSIFHDNFPFLPLRASAFACPAVATHLNSGFPKPLAPTGAASQSYQLPPVADLLRLRENALCILLARKSPAPLLERGFLKVLILVQG